jgi:hypothetical protein
MNRPLHFILVSEGSSDENIIPHLRNLLVSCGAQEASGTAPDYGRLPTAVSRDIESKIRAALTLEKNVDLLFIHRDADGPNSEPRREEISLGVSVANYNGKWIALVPVQELEAWLLLDEKAIRRAAGRPNGSASLNLPSPENVESLSQPKEKLRDVIIIASGASGKRLKKLRQKYPLLRARLLHGLPVGGVLDRVPSWARLKGDIEAYLHSP